ncbi:helix-turn-helix domain-containing protein [Methanothrix soehngenii]
MLKAYKFRIYPTKSQRTKMERTLVSRQLFNVG